MVELMGNAEALAKGCLRTLVAAGAALAMSATLARAADMPDYPPPPPAYSPPPSEVTSGWYLRGDIGGQWGLLTGAASAPFYPDPTDNSLGSALTYSVGVGIKSDWARTDFTFDYLAPMKYRGSVATAGDTTAKIQAAIAMFNGYIDLGTWRRFTPYIGAGAGLAYARAFDYASTGAPPFSGDTSNEQWKLAFAAMAGVAISISPRAKLDVGYRYLNIGDVKTGSDASGAMTFRNVAAHQVRVGLRWSFDDPGYSH
jgi:opacity protein-like surface antigen